MDDGCIGRWMWVFRWMRMDGYGWLDGWMDDVDIWMDECSWMRTFGWVDGWI